MSDPFRATNEIDYIWSMPWQVKTERLLWIEVMCFHMEYGVIPHDRRAMRSYQNAVDLVNLRSINQRELVTKHDVKARIEEFNHLANYLAMREDRFELIHLGMTSADVVDNIALIRMKETIAVWLRDKTITADADVKSFLAKASEDIPFRGIKGAVGTQQDQLDLLGSQELCDRLDAEVAMAFGFADKVLTNTGQVYPRSIDWQTVSQVMGATYLIPQVARPWRVLMNGYANMVSEYSGSQWNEGDVTTSSIRRVALPGFFQAADLALRGVKP